jgi:hypothetical protein
VKREEWLEANSGKKERGIGSKSGFDGMMAKGWPLLFYDSHNGR